MLEMTTLFGVNQTKGVNGLDKVVLQNHGWSAEVYLYGAHVASWKNKRQEFLFVSSKAHFKPPMAIRGGISVLFPLFPDKTGPAASGFARNSIWTIDNDSSLSLPKVADEASVDLLLRPTEKDLWIWPHRFEYRFRVALRPGGELVLTYRIKNINPDGKSFKFMLAYPAYFSVSDINEVRVEGLETLDYFDNLKNKERFTEQVDALSFESYEAEINRTYLSAPTEIMIMDHKMRQTFGIQKDLQLPDAVVWNPWEKKARETDDLQNDEYKLMLCAGAARIEKPVTLKPGEEWTAKQQLTVVNSIKGSN